MILLHKFNSYIFIAYSIRWAKWICVLLIFIGGTYISAIGQSSEKTDSIKNLLKEKNIDLTQKGDLYKELASSYRTDGLLDSALNYFTLATDIFESAGDTTKEIMCTNSMAEVYLIKGKNAIALEMLLAILPKATGLRDTGILAQAYNYIGRTYNQLGKYEPGIQYYEKALYLSKEAKLDKLMASTFYGMGMNYYGRGDFSTSLSHYQQALDIYTKMENKSAMAVTYSAMGNIYYDQGIYTKAIQLHIDALTINQKLNNPSGIAVNYSNIANVYFVQENYIKAQEYQTSSLGMHETIGNKTGMATNYYNLALIYDRLDQPQRALEAQLQSLKLNEEIQDQAGAIFCYKHLGDLYAAKGMLPEAGKSYEKAISASKQVGDSVNMARTLISLGIMQKNIPQLGLSRKNIAQGLSMAKDLGIKDSVRDGYYQLMTLDSMAGHYKEALANFRNYSLYNDSLTTESNNKVTHEIQARYDVEKKDQEIALLNKEAKIKEMEINKHQEMTKLMIGGFLLLVLMSIFVYQYYITKQKLKLQVLRNKIANDLHDEVGSTLSSIAIFSEVAQQQSKEVIPLLETIRDSSRKMLEAMGDIVWTINPENDQFEKIILRMRNFAFELLGARRIEFEFKANEDVSRLKLPMDVRKNLFLIFKEAANNLVKYSEANKAYFSVTEEKGMLTMVIRDNGRGFDLKQTALGNGIESMKQRAKDIGAQLQIHTQPGEGTSIELKLAI